MERWIMNVTESCSDLLQVKILWNYLEGLKKTTAYLDTLKKLHKSVNVYGSVSKSFRTELITK
jgi:hypothetical protein